MKNCDSIAFSVALGVCFSAMGCAQEPEPRTDVDVGAIMESVKGAGKVRPKPRNICGIMEVPYAVHTPGANCTNSVNETVMDGYLATDRNNCYAQIGHGSSNCCLYGSKGYFPVAGNVYFLDQKFNGTDRVSSEFCLSQGLNQPGIQSNGPATPPASNICGIMEVPYAVHTPGANCTNSVNETVMDGYLATDRNNCYAQIGHGSSNCCLYGSKGYFPVAGNVYFLDQKFNGTDRVSSEFCLSQGLNQPGIQSNGPATPSASNICGIMEVPYAVHTPGANCTNSVNETVMDGYLATDRNNCYAQIGHGSSNCCLYGSKGYFPVAGNVYFLDQKFNGTDRVSSEFCLSQGLNQPGIQSNGPATPPASNICGIMEVPYAVHTPGANCTNSVNETVMDGYLATDRNNCYAQIGHGSSNCCLYGSKGYFPVAGNVYFLDQKFNGTDRVSSEFCLSQGLNQPGIQSNGPATPSAL